MIIVATQDTRAITHSQVIRKPPKIKFQHNLVEFGRRRHRIRHFQKQYSIYILFCIGYYSEAFAFFYSERIAIDLTKMKVGGILKEMEMPDSVGRLRYLVIKPS